MGKLEEFKEERAALNKKVAELDKTIESLANAQWFLEEGEDIWFVDQFGNIQWSRWGNQAWSDVAFTQGHIFKTEKEARLEAQRRNLLQRFKMFRDKCNDGWKPDWSNRDKKWEISHDKEEKEFKAFWSYVTNSFSTFGYFKNEEDAQRAIELFGKEIIELFVECEG
jgi:hypothetical protein